MTKERKYESYKILITYSNGDTEEINYNGINTSNYTEMIKVYKSAKDQYSSESVTIDFIGTNSDGSMKIFFTKKFESEEENKPEDKVTENDSMTSYEVAEEFKKLANIFNERRNFIHSKLGKIDKDIDIDKHKLERITEIERNNEIKDYFENEDQLNLTKISIANNIGSLSIDRRDIKREIAIASILNKYMNEDVIAKIENVIKTQDNINKKKYDFYLQKDKLEKKVMKRTPYKNDMERIKLTSQLQKQYNHVYVDSETNEIVGYNTVKKIAR